MTTMFVPVQSQADREKLAELAGSIWREYWPAHIGAAQTEYMVEQFQSLPAITRDMALPSEPYEYWFVLSNTPDARGENARIAYPTDGESTLESLLGDHWRLVGYTGGHPEAATNRFFISKIYLLAAERGRGFASAVIRHYVTLCTARRFRAMYLTVNKYNEGAIRAYLGNKFTVIDAVETDIGSGFIMDDYIMERTV